MTFRTRPHQHAPTPTILLALIVCVGVLGQASTVRAETTLRLQPELQVLPPGGSGVVSVMIDEPTALRTVEVTLRGDPDRLSGVTAAPGAVFDGVSCFIWDDCEEEEPGLWHAFAVIIGSTCETQGPGELLRWTFTAGDPGGTILDPVEVKLYAPDGSLIEGTSSAHAVVLVSATTGTPPPAPAPALGLHPNPFNPIVNLLVDLDRDADARLTVYDLRGARIAQPWRGSLPAGRTHLEWRGVDDSGAEQPSGTYVFTVDLAGGQRVTAIGTLAR